MKVVFVSSFLLAPVAFSKVMAAEEHLHDLPQHIQEAFGVLTKAQENYNQVQDYTAEIYKEVFQGGEKQKEERTIIKFQKPFKVYLKWIAGKNKGAELLYVEGENNNKIIVKKKGIIGILGTMEMAPDGFWLRNFTKHSIKEAGFGGIIDKAWKQFKTAKEKNDIVSATCSLAELDGRPAHKVVLVVSPQGRDNGYYCRAAIQYFDAESYLPIKSTFQLWDNDEVEVFTFDKVKLNAGLTAKDFDRGNKEYHF